MSTRQIILIIITVILFGLLYLSWRSPAVKILRKKENINILLVGTDLVQNTLHADTIILMSYNPKNEFLDLLSLPRDTKITFTTESNKTHTYKLTETFAYYYKKENKNYISALDALKSLVISLLNERVKIPFYIQIDYYAFTKLIDIIGGVTIDIEEPIKYDDNSQNLHIDFKAGIQRLSGEEALKYVRYRGGAGDLGRIYRQQRFMKSIISQLKNPAILFKSPGIINFLMSAPHRNISGWDILSLLYEMRNVNIQNVRMSQLPGRPSGIYWATDSLEIDKALDIIFGVPASDVPQTKITIEVLNASDIPGAALEVTRKLRDCGFDVIDYKSLESRQPKTMVVDRGNNLRSAQSIGRIIGTEEIFTRFQPKRMVDISVYIGSDYRK